MLLPATYNYGFFMGFIGGYVVYDMMHYAIHHYTFKSALMKRIKKHHICIIILIRLTAMALALTYGTAFPVRI